MVSTLFIAILFIFPLLMMYLMNKINLSLLKVSIPSFLITSLFILSFFGAFILFFNLDSYRVELGVVDEWQILLMFILTTYAIFSLIIGFFCGKIIFRDFNYIQLIDNENNIELKFIEKMILMFLVIVSIILFTIYLNAIPQNALFLALKGEVVQAQVARSLMTNAFEGKHHWYVAFYRHILNFVTFTLFGNFLIRKTTSNFFIFLFVFLITSLAAIITTEKGLFVWLVIGLFFVFCLVKNKGGYPFKSGIVSICIMILSLIFSHVFFLGSNSSDTALKLIYSRALTGQITPVYFYLEYFPKHHDFLYGRSLPNPGGILPFDSYKLTIEMMRFINPLNDELGIVGSAPTVFWGELYANFGYIGVLLLTPILGLLIYTLHFLILKLPDSVPKVGFYVWLVLHIASIAQSGIGSFVFDLYFIITGLAFLFLVLARNNGKIIFKNS